MKTFYFILGLLAATNCFSQANRKVSTFVSFGANKTLYDRTITNNKGGPGFGLQTVVNTKTFITPLLEINADLFAGTKELYLTTGGKPIESKSDVLSMYVGPMFGVTKRLFISTTIGTSLYNNKAHFGLRPSVGFYPSQSRKWTTRVSYTNVFQRDAISKESFGYLSVAVGIKLF